MNWLGILVAVVWPPVFAFGCAALLCVCGKRSWCVPRGWLTRWLCGCVGVVATGLVWYIPETGIGLLSAAVAIVLWWWLRRRRDRAPKLAGAKSRARIAAMVAKVREAGKPRPALHPVPGGAR